MPLRAIPPPSVSRTLLNLDEEGHCIWEPTAWTFPAARLCFVTIYQSYRMTQLWHNSPICLAQDLEVAWGSCGSFFLPVFLGGGDWMGVDLSQKDSSWVSKRKSCC